VARLVKAPGIEKGGVVVNDGPQYASIALGQDLMTGFIGPVGTDYELSMSESIALRLLQPKAICVLK
ncbi:bacteriocin, partial [Candidatus Bathyarchaeota archaeon]|nr:bacteriocin [Candidatus Bathyarchaeota archaeon]